MISSRSLFALSLLLTTAAASHAQMTGILNLPYTAVKKTTTVQKLADGTTLTRVAAITSARDSQGRTMQKTDFLVPAVQETAPYTVIVQDFAARTTTDWMVPGKEATVMHLREMRAAPVKAAPPPNAPASSPSASGGNVVAYVTAGVAGTPIPGINGNLQPSFKREKLEGKVINGVYAEGNRTTTTFPIGFFGNDRPIVTVSETWTSPDLRINVASTNEDPRNGTTTIDLVSLDRGEPDPSLFTPPQGYQIKDVDPRNQ